MRLLHLPQEIVQHIIFFVGDYDLQNVERSCSRLYELVNEQVLWRSRCEQFQYWETRPGFEIEISKFHGNWKEIFVRRLGVEQHTTRCLEKIIQCSYGRIKNLERIAAYGYDAKDMLFWHLSLADTRSDALARRYHAAAAIGCIHRRRAVQQWRMMANNEPLSLEEALGSFDLFVLEDPRADTDYVAAILNQYAEEFRRQDPEMLLQGTKEKALALTSFLRVKGFIGASLDSYHELKNSFLGFSVRHDKSTLPIVSCVLLCALASRLGINASPCSFPYHVYAIVTCEDGSYLYLDPFRNADEVPREALEKQLVGMGIPEHQVSQSLYLQPGTAREIVLRTAHNIQNSTQQGRGASISSSSNISKNAAEYSAVCAFALLGGQISARTVEPLTRCLHEEFTADIGFVEKELMPMLVRGDREQASILGRFCGALRSEDDTPRKRKPRRTPEEKAIKYTVGTVFQHRKYHYAGVITGWTTNISMDRNLEGTVRIETSRPGFRQPFYYVLVDDCSMRYVAEENILEVRPSNVDDWNIVVGKYFKKFDKNFGRFVSNIQDEYPNS